MITRISLTYKAIIICFLVVPQLLFGQSNSITLDSTIRKLGEKFITDKQAVGLSIGIYSKGASYFYNFGSTQKEKNIPPSQNTVYEIGSITKTLVSFILANAVLEHRVNLDDDIRKYLKESYPNLEYNGNPIKIIHLANTTSLLPDWLPELPAGMKDMPADSALDIKINYYRQLTSKDLLKALHNVKLDSLPGTKSYHSNSGAQLLAYILETVYEIPMEKLIMKYITVPNKMNSSSFFNSDNPKGAATGYTASGKKAVYESVMPYFKYAAGMGSSAKDMVNYIRMLLDTTNNAVSLSFRKTVNMDVTNGKVIAMRPDNQASPDIYSVSLNWFKYQPSDSSSQIWSDGGTNGFNSYLVIYPHINSGVIVMANKSDEKIFRALPGIAYEISKLIGPN